MLDHLQNTIGYLLQCPGPWRMLVVVLLFLVGPLSGLPLLAIAAFSVFLLGLAKGLACLIVGYFLATYLYLLMASRLGKFVYIQERLNALSSKWPFLQGVAPFSAVVASAMFLPYLPLVVALGLLQKDKVKVLFALFLGALPGLIMAVQAGYLGEGAFRGGLTVQQVWLSIAIVLLALFGQILVRKKVKLKRQSYANSHIE